MTTPNTTDRTTREQQAGQRPAEGATTTSGAASGQPARATTPGEPRGTQGERAQQVPVAQEGRQPPRETRREMQREPSGGGAPVRRRETGRGIAPYGVLGSPFALLQQVQSEMDRLFEDFGLGGRSAMSPWRTTGRGLGGATSGAGPSPWAPQLDVFRRGDELVVRADLPGLGKDDVSVEVEDGVLTLRGERRQESTEDREGYYWSERSYGSFERSVALPEGVDESQAKASFRDGVLEVTVPAPKAEPQRKRRIEIG